MNATRMQVQTENEKARQRYFDFVRGVSNGDLQVVAKLLKDFPDAIKLRLGDYSLLHVAATHGHAAVAKRLIACGATVDAANQATGETPLFWAARMGHVAVVKVLLKAGADPLKQDTNGQTPSSVHKQANGAEVQRLLDAKVAKKQEREAAELRALIDKEVSEPLSSFGARRSL